jgi:hypothetical protein
MAVLPKLPLQAKISFLFFGNTCFGNPQKKMQQTEKEEKIHRKRTRKHNAPKCDGNNASCSVHVEVP